ncbi:HD-GYP domain-containing protein [Halalkalibacter krulwichiae]|uniref:Cyclic di-GMP phosphodiesterase response regulator RpfG n=1 Tax=Halalkalibacter krulwichiae TaxID=199441 RepID=A0A1X9MH53_9BACI|nr:HD-GYP domain-containing protein [Halalkalibacter krulwichiae]ARK31964.1 Cyclic di-GMP phosphodiesterase response regulator RpfG [Halalkalibacter krulwichiae]
MRLVSTRSVEVGAKLGKAIYNDSGQVLLNTGAMLTERVLNRLIGLGYTFIYIQDEQTKGVEFNSVVKEETKRLAIHTIKTKFQTIADGIQLRKSLNCDRLNKDFSKVVEVILDDIKNNKNAVEILSDVFIYDSYIFTHSLNVTVYTLRLAIELGFSDKQLMEIGLGALLHDVGKMAIPVEILNKPDRLTDEEYQMIKSHARAGYDLLRNVPNVSLVTAHCALQHHERPDGTGYPQGLKGNEIHLYAKIIAVADVFDAVTSNRIYRKPMLPHEGLELLYSGVGHQFEHSLVEAFRNTIAVYPVGLRVKLSDGRKGFVMKQNKQLSTHPIVHVTEEHNLVLAIGYDIDLTKHLNVTIIETETTLAASNPA